MTTPFNALPQGRMYLVFRNPSEPYPVVAPAGGTVSWILGPKPDFRLEITMRPGLAYFVDHVELEPGIQMGSVVQAGQRIARHSGLTCCLDFGVQNDASVSTFVNQARYSAQVINADSPLRYFVEPLRSEFYALVDRQGGEKDGVFNYDRPGRLAGNWFHEDQPVEGSLGPDAWPKQLAFAYSNTHPSMVLVSVAGTLPLVNLFAVQDGATDPADVSVASGKVTYRLYQKSPPVSEGGQKGAAQVALLIVQMLDDRRIRVEQIPGSAQSAEFTSNAKIYLR